MDWLPAIESIAIESIAISPLLLRHYSVAGLVLGQSLLGSSNYLSRL
jgi:hypothetical protein